MLENHQDLYKNKIKGVDWIGEGEWLKGKRMLRPEHLMSGRGGGACQGPQQRKVWTVCDTEVGRRDCFREKQRLMVSDTAQGIRKGKDISAFGLDLLAHLHVINITVISK